MPFFAFLAGCSSVGAFDYTYELDEQHVDGNPLGGLLGGLFEIPVPVEVDLEAETAARETGPAQHVYLTELTLEITAREEPAGDSDDFDFLDVADIYVESRAADSTLPRVLVARLPPRRGGERTLSFELLAVDLLPYIEEGARLTSSAEGEAPPDDVSFDGYAVLTIEVL